MEDEIGDRLEMVPELEQRQMAGAQPLVDWGKVVHLRWVSVDLRSTYFGIGWANSVELR